MYPISVLGVVVMVLSSLCRTLNCMVGQMKHILATEQKKTDFRPEDENNVMIQCTAVSSELHPTSTSGLIYEKQSENQNHVKHTAPGSSE